MKIPDFSFSTGLDNITRTATTLTKLGIFTGGICIVAYSLKIGYFPQDLSIGDGALFLMAAGCFGIVYAFFVACLVSLGIFFSPLVRVPFNAFIKALNRFSKRKRPPAHELAPFDWITVLFAIFAVILIVAFGKQEHSAYWNLPLLSIALYFFYSIFHSSGKKLRAIHYVENAILHTEDKNNLANLGNPEHLRRSQWISLAAVLVMPLLLGHVSGQLLDAAMRFGKIRVEHPTIYVKSPYALMLPKNLVPAEHTGLADYTRFDGTVVLFNGFGKNTVISFPDAGVVRTIRIPNDYIIVE